MLTALPNLETYLARNFKKGKLKITATNPLPCVDLREVWENLPENVPVHFKLLGSDGYYYHIFYEVLEGECKRTKIDYVLPYRPTTLEIDEAMLAPLLSSSASEGGGREENSPDMRAFKQRHRELELGDMSDQRSTGTSLGSTISNVGGLKISLRDFCSQFPVVKTETTQPPLLYYSFREHCDYDAIAQHYASYKQYYTKLEEFYREPVPVNDFYLQATNIGLTFHAYEAHPHDEEGAASAALFRRTSADRIKFRAFVFVQFAFCAAPKTVWDEDDDLDFI